MKHFHKRNTMEMACAKWWPFCLGHNVSNGIHVIASHASTVIRMLIMIEWHEIRMAPVLSVKIYYLFECSKYICIHYSDVIISAMASQITSLTIVYTAVISGVDQRKHQSSASLAFVCGIHRWPVNSPHKGPVTRKMFPFDDAIMCLALGLLC